MLLGRFDEALGHCGRALELDPLSVHTVWSNGTLNFYQGRSEESIPMYERAEALESLSAVYWEHAYALLAAGRFPEAVDQFEQWAELEGHQQPELARFVMQGIIDVSQRAEAIEALAGLRAEGRVNPADWVAEFAYLGETDRALSMLEQMLSDRNPNVIYIGVDPGYDPLRREPRFIQIIEELGLPNGGPAYR